MFGMEENIFWTRDDLDEFGYELEDTLRDEGYPMSYNGGYTDEYNNMDFDFVDDSGYDYNIQFKVDMRKIRSPQDFLKYIDVAGPRLEEKYEEYHQYD